jgi:hypothetical protein
MSLYSRWMDSDTHRGNVALMAIGPRIRGGHVIGVKKLPPMPSSNRLVASFFVAVFILWGAGMIALVFYVRAETSRSNARKN